MNITEITAQKTQDNTPIRLAAYSRVSSNSEDQLHSFAAQIRYYKDYEKKHPHYKLVDIYADEGLTGTSMEKRDEFNRLIRDCKKGKIDRVIVKSVSRFARNTKELLITLRMLKDIGVSVYFEEQDIDTDKMNAEMIVTFPGMAAQQESISISDNMRWSYKKRMESGDFNCCAPAYGFDLKNGQLIEKPEEAAVVRRIFSMFLQGIGQQSIADTLNAEGIIRRNGDGKWLATTVYYILKNERYQGDALLQKKYTTETLPFKRKKNNGEKPQYYVENSNVLLVSRETFRAAQELLKSRIQNKRNMKSHYPLTGIIRCHDCGWGYRRQVISGTAYWFCTGKANGAKSCRSIRIREDAVYDTFINMIMKLKEYRNPILGCMIAEFEKMLNMSGESQDKIRGIDKKIAELSSQNLVIARLHTNGILNANEYSSQSSEINNKISALRSERRKLLNDDENDEALDSLKLLDGIINDYVPDGNFDEELFGQVVQQITAISNAELTFKLIGGIELTEEIPMKGRCKIK